MTTDNTSRLTIVALVFALLGAVIVLRLGYLQVIQHDYFSVLADASHMRKFEIPAQRGEVYVQDRGEAVPVAMNRNLQTLYADTRYIYDQPRVVKALEEVLGEDYTQQLNEADGYLQLKKEVTYEDAEAIEAYELSGVGFSDNYVRTYPEGELGAQVLGFVNHDGEGQYGIEGSLDDRLSGTPGLFDAQTDSQGMPLATSENIQIEPQHGQDVVLNIDRNIQAFVEKTLADAAQEMGAESAHAVIMDPNSGAVRAMANYPSFNPNEYTEVEDYERFSNQTVSGSFEPGSGFKMFTMATGLETGAVTPGSTFHDTGSVQVADATIRNAGTAPGQKSMNDVIVDSLNTGIVHVLKQLGGGDINTEAKATLYEFFTGRFQLSTPTGIEQPSEPELNMHQPSAVGPVEYANMAFGQGISTTMVRMSASMAAIVNGGTIWQPQLVDAYRDGERVEEVNPKVAQENVISSQTAAQLRAMMEGVVEEGGGYGAQLEGYRVGGKTGTAQIASPDGGYLEGRYIGTFTGFAPVEDPEYIMMVRIDEPDVPGYAGSAAAGVVFGDIMDYLLEYAAVPPSQNGSE